MFNWFRSRKEKVSTQLSAEEVKQERFRGELDRLREYHNTLNSSGALDDSRRAQVLNQVIGQMHSLTDYISVVSRSIAKRNWIEEAFMEEPEIERRNKTFMEQRKNLQELYKISDDILAFGVDVVMAFPINNRRDINIQKDLMRVRVQYGLDNEHYIKAKTRLFRMLGILDYMC